MRLNIGNLLGLIAAPAASDPEGNLSSACQTITDHPLSTRTEVASLGSLL